MKNKFFLSIVMLLALVFSAQAQLGAPQSILSYTAGSGYYYSQNGTNDQSGYTNATKIIDVSNGTTVQFLLHHQGSVNYSNNITLYIRPAFGSATSDISTTGPGISRIVLAAAGNTSTTLVTNLTSVGSPFLAVQLENPIGNDSITNLVLRFNVKTP